MPGLVRTDEVLDDRNLGIAGGGIRENLNFDLA